MNALKNRLLDLLHSSERYTKTDMVNLARSGSWLAGSDLLISFASLGLSILIAAYVSQETFGIYRYVLSLAGIAVAVSLTGMNSAVTRAVALGRDGALSASLMPQICFAFLQMLLIGAAALYYGLQGNMPYCIALTIVAVLAPLSGVFNTYTAYLNGKEDFGRLGSYKIQAAIINIAAMAVVVLTNPTLIALVTAYFLSTFITNAWFLRKTLKRVPASKEMDPADIAYGKHLSVMNSAGIVATQIDALLLYHLLGPVALALYTFAILIPERFRSLLAFLPNAALPRLSNRTAGEIQSTLAYRLAWLTAATLGLALVYAALAPYIFRLFFPAYIAAIPYTQLAGLFAVTTVAGYLSTALTALKAQRALYITSVVTLITKILLTIVAVLMFGIVGAIAARLLAACVQTGLGLYFVSRTS